MNASKVLYCWILEPYARISRKIMMVYIDDNDDDDNDDNDVVY